MGNIHVKLYEFGAVVREMSFKEKVYGWMHDGRTNRQRPITIAHLEPGELKIGQPPENTKELNIK